MLKITFLGTGTSQGVPVIACECRVCQSQDIKDKRLRTSIMIESETTCVVIDSGPDFRQQMLRANVKKVDAIVFTHSHKDHIAGTDDVRAFNYVLQRPMDVFATEATQTKLKVEFDYAFSGLDYPGIPKINLHTIHHESQFQIGDLIFKPILVMHRNMPVLGFRVNDFTYVTDANFISDKEMEKIVGSTHLVLNALRHEKHVSHFTLKEAIEISSKIVPQQTYFTHISHQLGLHEEVEVNLPLSHKLAYDMLKIFI